MEQWNKKSSLWLLFMVILYVIASVFVCVLGSVHPILFVGYQITAAILLPGIAGKAFDRLKAPGAAACLALGMLVTFFIIQDANLWHCIPLVVIAVIAELVRFFGGYTRAGDLPASVIMSFSTFGYYGQIWFNRNYTYDCAVEEMPAGYADTLMQLSPAWAFPAVLVIGIVIAAVMYCICEKLFKFSAV